MKYNSINQLFHIIGGNPAPKGDDAFSDSGLPFVKMKDLGKSHFSNNLIKIENRISDRKAAELNLKVIKKGSILIPRSGSVALNHRAILGTDAYMVSHICALEVIDNKVINNTYAYYYLRTISMERITKKTTGLDAITFTDLGRIQIPLPPLDDQIRIATVLTRAEKMIAKRKESIKALDELLKSNFQEMFGDPVRNEKGWNRDRLKNLCGFITKGTTPKSKDIFDTFDNELIPFIKVYHICNDGSINFNYNPSFITNKTHIGYLKRSIVYPNDILMNIVGPPLGKIGLVPNAFQEWNVNQAIAIFRCGENLNPKYLLFTLKSSNFSDSIIKMAVGIRQLNLSLEQCRDINIPVPPLHLQNQFATIVDKIQSLKARCTQSLTELENFYGSLSQRAFKGELDLSKVSVEKEKHVTELQGEVKGTSSMIGEQSVSKKYSEVELIKTVIMPVALKMKISTNNF